MKFSLDNYIKRLKNANITFEKGGTGQYKGDYYVAGGSSTPHIHIAKSGNFVGLKIKMNSITTLVNEGEFKIEAINGAIEDWKTSATPNDRTVTSGLVELGRLHKFGM